MNIQPTIKLYCATHAYVWNPWIMLGLGHLGIDWLHSIHLCLLCLFCQEQTVQALFPLLLPALAKMLLECLAAHMLHISACERVCGWVMGRYKGASGLKEITLNLNVSDFALQLSKLIKCLFLKWDAWCWSSSRLKRSLHFWQHDKWCLLKDRVQTWPTWDRDQTYGLLDLEIEPPKNGSGLRKRPW